MKRINVILSAAALLLVSSFSASAQFAGYDYDPFKKYEPSAAAKAADPKASDKTIEEGNTKSYAEICGAYENMPKELIPYQPYYEFLKDYLYMYVNTGTDKNSQFNYDRSFVVTKKENALFRRVKEYEDGRYYKMYDDPKKCLLTGEHALNTYLCAFLADPNCHLGMFYLVLGLDVYNAINSGYFESRVSEYSTDEYSVVYNDRGEMLTLWELAPKRTERIAKLATYVKEVAKHVDLDNATWIADYFYRTCQKFKDGEDQAYALSNVDDAIIAFEIAMAHPQFATCDKVADFKAKYAEVQQLWKTIIDKNTPREPMPATYSVDAALLAKEQELINDKFPEYKGYKLYNLDNHWSDTRDYKYRSFGLIYMDPDPLNVRPEGLKRLIEFAIRWQKNAFGECIDSYAIAGGGGPYLE